MKNRLIGALKIGVPLAIGVWLVLNTYNGLNPQQKNDLFTAFRQADVRWLLLAMAVGWLAHVSRGWRWRYLLEPVGYTPGFWNSYHAVMIGYFMNMFLPRAGEASRAAALYRSEKVPFEKGFGTILAERVVDMVMLLGIALITVLLQLEKLDVFQTRIEEFRAGQGTVESSTPWGLGIVCALVMLAGIGAYLIHSRPALRARFMDLLRGFGEGLRAVFHTKSKGAFLLHTALIWLSYLGMFQIGFLSLDSTAHTPFAGILAGFVAGAIGIVLVQGGIGVYPAFVGLITSIYLAAPEGGGLIRPDALAMGWLLWVAQTVLIIGLGGLSLLLTALKKPVA